MEKEIIFELTEDDLQEFLNENESIANMAGDSHDMLAEYTRLHMMIIERTSNFLYEKFNGMNRIMDALIDVLYDLEERGFRRTTEHFRISDKKVHIPIEEALAEDGNEDLLEEGETTVAKAFVIPVKQYHDDKLYYVLGVLAYVEDEEGNMTNDTARVAPGFIITEEKSFIYHNRIMDMLLHDIHDSCAKDSFTTIINKIYAMLDGAFSEFKGVDKTFAKNVHKGVEEFARIHGKHKLPVITLIPSGITEGACYIKEITPFEKFLRIGVEYTRENNKDKPKKGQYALTEKAIHGCLSKLNFMHEENWEDKIMDKSIPL